MGTSLQTNKYIFFLLGFQIFQCILSIVTIYKLVIYLQIYFSVDFVRIVIVSFISISLLFYYHGVFDDFETRRKARENTGKCDKHL